MPADHQVELRGGERQLEGVALLEPYARREVSDLIYRLEDLSRSLGGRDAQPLPSAVENALREL